LRTTETPNKRLQLSTNCLHNKSLWRRRMG